ncbi:1251_t:CDS:2 [Racocetra fulgida]|uniref:1251_t:CDS:1 n=1 Tax=Racocetra fulgida TaxID=60492 RepID=A0A9N8WJS9_9GLOM|nr:1251_t:CDS:2 [Racocetra fulgida]
MLKTIIINEVIIADATEVNCMPINCHYSPYITFIEMQKFNTSKAYAIYLPEYFYNRGYALHPSVPKIRAQRVLEIYCNLITYD